MPRFNVWEKVNTSPAYTEIQKSKKNPLKGPLRVARLCVLTVIFPGLLLGIPLYMRYNVYIQQVYPVGMSDIRIVDARISTTWCQRQVVWSNTTFNAYLLSEPPQIQTDLVKVSMTRHLVLEDDMKEYWGFYLLQGSTVTVSTCVRWPGASLIMIRGHKHLKQCAYIGDDSSEELEEFEQQILNGTSGEDSNEPEKMKKVMSGVVLHDHDNISETDDDSSTLHHHHHQHHPKITFTTKEMQDRFGKVDNKRGQNVHLAFADHILNPNLVNIKGKKDYKLNLNLDVPGSKEMKEMAKRPPTSGEVYDEILSKLEKLGDKKKEVLDRLQDKLEDEALFNDDNVVEEPKRSSKESSVLLEKLKKLGVSQGQETQKEEKTATAEEGGKTRRKRQISFGRHLHNQLNKDDEEADTAKEEDTLVPDGIADVRGTVNETTAQDTSNSEFWSSFSSSEERLLECEGLLLNLPLTPHRKCEAHRPEDQLAAAAGPNTVTYKVPMNGYYFFVFNSENEVQPNFLRIHFRLEKTTYNVTHALASCKNQTHPCSLPLKFWSNDKVVLELPVRANDSLWNQEFLAVSTCEPRTAIYIGCVVAVPLLIILFAFQ